ncbi:hypothetical protein AMK16_15130 [Streptomyces sp. CB00455]|uniref:hypothetical protein n=1 Tax=Streptomyces sp. CB00455 TaxID=1703927 RepID=UPI00093EEB39|nr:hypothetical protein [Streptomyces sp. CB00455]OKK19441.1 hypothetical protein AMK16_15130 [Streptomyces sp. CB00455]
MDVVAPLTVRRIPAGAPEHRSTGAPEHRSTGAPEHHRSAVGTLSEIVNDHPYCDPHDVLTDEAAFLPAPPPHGALAGFLVTMNATCWYAASERITEQSVLEEMVKGVEEAVPLLDDRPCARTAGAHPDTGDPDHASEVGYLLRSPGGRAELGEQHGWDGDEDGNGDEPLDGWVCPQFLRGLAAETLDTLKGALT